MAKGYMNSILADYVCVECGSINKSMDRFGLQKSKFSVSDMYCPKCEKNTKSIKLGEDASLIKSDLKNYYYDDLDEVQKLVLDLLDKGELKKTK